MARKSSGYGIKLTINVMSSNPCNIAIFRFFKMAAAAILDFSKFYIFNGRNGQ